MKYKMRFLSYLMAAICLVLFPVTPPACASVADDPLLQYQIFTMEGAGESFISYPVLTENSIAADRINQQVLQEAKIEEYQMLLSRLSENSTGLKVSCDVSIGEKIYSVLITAEGKMLSGPPSRVYYPMVFDRTTGERISFDSLFSDPAGACEQIEQYLTDTVEPQLSTYLENRALFPVPYDRFFLDGLGRIYLYYDKNQLSFLSGDPGAVSFRYSELWGSLNVDADSPCMDVQQSTPEDQYPATRCEDFDRAEKQEEWCYNGYLAGIGRVYVGDPLNERIIALKSTTDSGFYPGGAYYETEDPALRGTLLLTDENEEIVTGLLTSNVDSFGIETGKTSLDDAMGLLGNPAALMNTDEETAEMYLVCPGTAAIYSTQILSPETWEALPGSYTLYADIHGIVQYIKLAYAN